MNKKKLLIFVDWYEPGYKGGGPIRSIANFVENMHGYYELFVFTSDRDHGDTGPYTDVVLDEWVSQSHSNVYYASCKSLSWRKIVAIINGITPDFVYVNSMYSLYFAIYPMLMKRLKLFDAKLVLAPRGMLQEGALVFKKKKKLLFLKTLNLLGVPKMVTGHATDEQEKADILQLLPSVKTVEVISNFSAKVITRPEYPDKQLNQVRAVFVSRISAKKNLQFLLSILLKLEPHIQFVLTIGGEVEDVNYWEECMQLVAKMPSNVRVDPIGPVRNADVAGLLQKHHIFVLPTLGENFGHAIFEALAVGRPVLISDKTPWRELERQKAGWDLSLTETKKIELVIEKVAAMEEDTFREWCDGALRIASKYVEANDNREQYLNLFN